MKALFTVQEKIPAIWWVFVMLCGSRAAKIEFRPPGIAERNGKCEETKRTA
jgi:hypothetical protein